MKNKSIIQIACLLLIFPSLFWTTGQADSNPDSAVPDLPFQISGWTEIVQSVSDLNRHVLTLQDIAGWEVILRGSLDETTLSAWQLDPVITGTQVLMRNPGSSRGYIRLVQFHGAGQLQIRSSAQPWESGGILDVNVRVLDMDANFHEFQSYGWGAFSDPVQYSFGPFEVKEWITTGPDGLSFALIERIRPELEGWPEMRDISRAFNSTQVVRDMPSALHFYREVLGFQKYMSWTGVSESPGPNVLGLPRELTTTIEREVWILHPHGINEGSVELLHFNGLSGRDLADRAVPPNLGMLMLRFPVKNLDALAVRLADYGIEPEGSITRHHLKPWGEVRQLSVRAPDGAWLDFYEASE
jgi:catechol 2,3-dioxygenase-like lactoylglutathione lyase family enzyme